MKKMTRKEIKRDIRRFLRYLSPDPKSECIVFTGHCDRKGYGRFRTQILPTVRGMVKAHRLSYHIFRGPIPDDFTIDHICGNTSCVNPYHLRPLSRAENTIRGNIDRARRNREFRRVLWTLDDGEISLPGDPDADDEAEAGSET